MLQQISLFTDKQPRQRGRQYFPHISTLCPVSGFELVNIKFSKLYLLRLLQLKKVVPIKRHFWRRSRNSVVKYSSAVSPLFWPHTPSHWRSNDDYEGKVLTFSTFFEYSTSSVLWSCSRTMILNIQSFFKAGLTWPQSTCVSWFLLVTDIGKMFQFYYVLDNPVYISELQTILQRYKLNTNNPRPGWRRILPCSITTVD